MGSERNPLEQFLEEKKAGFLRNVATEARGQFAAPAMARNLVSQGAGAAMSAIGAAAVVGAGVAASKVYDAATKGRDFRMMLEHDPTLAAKQESEPRLFNQFYSTLRTFNPDFARNPVVAAGYMHQMMDDPINAGSLAVNTLDYRDKIKSPFEPVQRAALSGAGSEKKSTARARSY